MKITGFGSIKSTGSVKKRGSASSVSNFAELLSLAEASEAAGANASSEVTHTAALNNLLALQEISEEDVKRQKLMRQGSNLLDILEKLRHQLLMGTIPAHLLVDLSRNISLQKQFVTDPKLNSIIEDIELRAAVELAKFEAAIEQKNRT